MEKINVTGNVCEICQPEFMSDGAERQTIVVSYKVKYGEKEYEKTVPVGFYGKAPKCLEQLHALNIGVGDLVSFPATLGGSKSKNGAFWNARVEGDIFKASVIESAKPNTSDIAF